MKIYGNLTNRIMETGKAEPKIGDGATLLMWSDRRAYTIIDVAYFHTGKRAGQPSKVTLQRDTVSWRRGQAVGYAPNPDGAIVVAKIDKFGHFQAPGGAVLIGERDEYDDPS